MAVSSIRTKNDSVSCSSAAIQPSCSSSSSSPHRAVVLFYKYFVPSESPPVFSKYAEFYVDQLQKFQRDLCTRLHLKGRILLAAEGINGTVSAADQNVLDEYIAAMENLDVLRDLGPPPSPCVSCSSEESEEHKGGGEDEKKVKTQGRRQDEEDQRHQKLFQGVDWKFSSTVADENDGLVIEPFPDLKISLVKEIVSTGGMVPVQNVGSEMAGRHLSPKEFHNLLMNSHHHNKNDNNASPLPNSKEIVLIDVRNTFEHDIGHFIHPHTGQAAMSPEMVTFSSFDQTFCAKYADSLKDKKVLMYCTGGIRCEKASVMLKQRGVQDVNQLQGGIHRYLEQYGRDGCFKGLNFVFDQRVGIKPPPPPAGTPVPKQTQSANKDDVQQQEQRKHEPVASPQQHDVVGRCSECQLPFDEICGSRVCTVCRDLVLVCHTCRRGNHTLREYHCRRHSSWKRCYFTFLEIFSVNALQEQRQGLQLLRDALVPPNQHKNTRRTMLRQIEKVTNQIAQLESNTVFVNPGAPRRCRTCFEPNTICDGRCWGFWKAQQQRGESSTFMVTSSSTQQDERIMDKDPMPMVPKRTGPPPPPIEPIAIGDQVEPGPQWNALRLGEPYTADGVLKRGTVVELKSWAGNEPDTCVAVLWNMTTPHELSMLVTNKYHNNISHDEVETNDTSTTTATDSITSNAGTHSKKTSTTIRSRNQPKIQPQIYRWGVFARDGCTPLYDVQKVK
jgi:predicted sulfurtransferase